MLSPCVSVPSVRLLCSKGSLGSARTSRSWLIMTNYDCFSQISLCSFTTPTLTSQWLFFLARPSLESLRSTFVSPVETMVLLFQCPRHLALDSLLLLWTLTKIEQFLPPDFLCHGHMLGSHLLFVLMGTHRMSCLHCVQLLPAHSGVSALDEQYWERADPAAMSWLKPSSSHSESPDGSVKANNLPFFDHFPQLSGEVVVFLPMTLHNYFFH